MNKRIIVFCLLMISVFLVLSPDFTGWLTTSGTLRIGFSVAQKTDICITILEIPVSVPRYQSTSITFWVENCGNSPASGNLHIYIMNSNSNTTSAHLVREFPNIIPLKSVILVEQFIASFGPGNYWISVAYEINGTMYPAKNLTETFNVVASYCIPGEVKCSGNDIIKCSMYGDTWDYVMTCPYDCLNGGCAFLSGGAPPPVVQGEPLTDVYVEYSQNVSLNPGMEFPLIFKVINIGDTDVIDLTLSLRSNEIFSELESQLISELEINESVVFLGELSVPENIEEGIYYVDWELTSTKLNKTGKIMVNITYSTMKYKSENLISYYDYLIEYVDEEIADAKRNGKNVSIPMGHSKDAKFELAVAKEMHRLGLYEEAIMQLDLTRKKIKDMVTTLVRAKFLMREEKPTEITPEPIIIDIDTRLIAIAVLIVGISVVIFIAYKKYLKRKMLLSPGKWEPSKIKL